MSKMSQAHAELTEQAAKLGFESIAEAEANGYHVSYAKGKVKLAYDVDKSMRLAHDELIKDRNKIIYRLEELTVCAEGDLQTIYDAIDFIKENIR